MSQIFERIEINNLNAKNRLFRSATWESLASPEGYLNDEIYSIYEELAQGGVGTIVTGLTDVSPYDWALVGNMRLCSDFLIPDYEKLADVVHKYQCNILAEINMNKYMRPERHIVTVGIDDLTTDDLQDIAGLYTNAAIRAYNAHFDGVQLHLAYGWFLNRLIDPAYNHRNDLYGGTVENRVRLIKEIICKIRETCKTFHISAKFSFFDDTSGDFALDECVSVCKALAAAGIDSIEVLGGHSPKETGTKHESCYWELAQAAKAAVQVPIILTGNNHDVKTWRKSCKGIRSTSLHSAAP